MLNPLGVIAGGFISFLSFFFESRTLQGACHVTTLLAVINQSYYGRTLCGVKSSLVSCSVMCAMETPVRKNRKKKKITSNLN